MKYFQMSSRKLTCVEAGGNVIKSEIIGKVQTKINLSGMPECKFGLNDKAYYEV